MKNLTSESSEEEKVNRKTSFEKQHHADDCEV